MASKQALVVGCGAVGLRTAVELLRRNVKVVLRAPHPPLHPSNTSQGAGGLWMPFHCDDDRVEKWSKQTLEEILPMALNSSNDLVERVPAVYLLREHTGPTVEDFTAQNTYSTVNPVTTEGGLPPWTQDPRLDFQHLTIEMLSWQNHVHRLKIPPQQELFEDGYRHAWFFYPPVVDAPIMLNSLLTEVEEKSDNVDVETNHFYADLGEMVEDAREMGCDMVVNATGLGSKELLPDERLVAARGVLHQYDRKECHRREAVAVQAEFDVHNTEDAVIMTEDEPWGSESRPCYMIPRGNHILVGGTYLEGDIEPSLREDESDALFKNAELMGIDTSVSKPISQWVGFRPYRTGGCRVELDNEEGIPIVHAYGFGGSGWTLNVGVAHEVADLLAKHA